jgi:hypothetical protein
MIRRITFAMFALSATFAGLLLARSSALAERSLDDIKLQWRPYCYDKECTKGGDPVPLSKGWFDDEESAAKVGKDHQNATKGHLWDLKRRDKPKN